MKAILKSDCDSAIAKTPSGNYPIVIEHDVEYDFLYSDDGDRFYLIIDDRIYEEVSTCFDFVN